MIGATGRHRASWYPAHSVVRFAALAILTALSALSAVCAEAAESLTVATWGGSYERASKLAYHDPFVAETGIHIDRELYSGGLAQVRAQVDLGKVHWDIVDMEIADAVRGCDEGLLEPIDPTILEPASDGTPPQEDFFPETLTECGVGILFYSTVIAYNDENFTGPKPSTLDDFFDLNTFPGRRGMRRTPLVNLEFALMADGVPVDEVYATLDTEEGMERAFLKLDTIKEHIVWWEAGAQPPQMLADREVAMTTAFNGRIFNAQVVENQPFTVVWDGQVLDIGQMVVVKGSPNLDAAMRFLTFATTAESMAAVGDYISYSPARYSGLPLVTTHLETGVEMQPHMPTYPNNLTRALRNDWRWWADNLDEVNERFSSWLLY